MSAAVAHGRRQRDVCNKGIAVTVPQTLDEANRLLRSGRVDAAIAAYRDFLEARPDDWTTANRLGDLYAQTGHNDQAVHQFSRVAKSLVEKELFPKAAALYKKVLKLAPGDESAREQLVDIAVRQGFIVDAIGHLTVMAERRRASGDDAGALEQQHRIDRLRHPLPKTSLVAPDPAAALRKPDGIPLGEPHVRPISDDGIGTAAAVLEMTDGAREHQRGPSLGAPFTSAVAAAV